MSPQGSDAGSGKQFFSLSAGSYLDRLPPELREKIYKLVMADWNWTRWLHIVRDYEREDYQIIGYSHAMGTSRKRLLTYVPCVSVREEEPKLSMCTRFPTQHDACKGWKAVYQRPPTYQGLYLSLALTCRHIYREAISLLYTRVSFDLLDGPTAHRFLTLVPISQLNQIKHLRIAVIFLARCCHSTSSPHSSPEKRLEATKQFQEICVILQRMKGLNELRLGIFRDPEQIVSNREFLAPLESVSVQKGGVFVVTLPWADQDNEDYEEWDVPYRVERKVLHNV